MAVPQFPISLQGSWFVCNLESFRAKPYQDSGGIWTIGYGTTIPAADVPKYKDGISQQTAMMMFWQRAEPMQKQLAKTPVVSLAQHQLDAIFSLVYNIGFPTFMDSTIYKHLAVRDVDLSPWLLFIKDNKKQVSQGLVRRRRLELRLFVYGDYSTD